MSVGRHRAWRKSNPERYEAWLQRKRHWRYWFKGWCWYRWHWLQWRLGIHPGVRLVRMRTAPNEPEDWRLEIAGRRVWMTSAIDMYRADPCVYCGNPHSGSLDHIVPRAGGGPSRWRNLAPACKSCNNAKGSMGLLLFLATKNIQRAKKRGKFRWNKAQRQQRYQAWVEGRLTTPLGQHLVEAFRARAAATAREHV